MPGHAQRQHRRFSPSQAERFRICYGSTNLLARVPRMPESEYSIEGTKAHEVLQAALENGIRRAREAHEDYSTLCLENLNTGTNFFYYSIQIALNYIYGILDDNPGSVLYVERFVNPPIESAPGEAGGYCDVAIHIPAQRILYIIDYKHGAGVTKAVKGNKQAMQYGMGFLFEENAVIDPQDIDAVVMVIVQPRAFHPDGAVREYELTPAELWVEMLDLDEDISRSLKPDAPLVPDDNGKTTDHCRFCDARTLCPAREAQAVKAIGPQFRHVTQITAPGLPNVQSLDVDRLAQIRLHAPMLRKFLNDCDEHIDALLRSGYNVPFAKLVEVEARRQWYGDPKDIAKKLAALADVKFEDVTETKLIPITHAEKLVVEAFKRRVGRGRKNQAAADARKSMAFLTLKQSSGNLTVVDEDDPRPSVNKASQHFAQIDGLLQDKTREGQDE